MPVLTGTTALPLTLAAAPLNRFLFCLTNAQYIQGPLDKVTEHGGGFDVCFAGRPESEHYKKVVIRHGPTAALNRWFPDIHKACSALVEAARVTPDLSREPIFNGSVFETVLTEAAKELEASVPSIASAEVRQAAAAAQSDELATAAFQRYREGLTERIKAAQSAKPDASTLQGGYIQRSVLLVAERAQQRPDQSNRNFGSSETADLDWLLAGPPIRYVVGGAGVGKTTLLQSLAEQALGDDRIFPIFARLQTLDLRWIKSILISALDWTVDATELPARDLLDALRRVYLTRLLQGRVVALLDGLDEMPPDQKRRIMEIGRHDFAKLGGNVHPQLNGEQPQRRTGDLPPRSGGNKIVISSRSPAPDIEATGLPIYAIAPLSQADTGALIASLTDPEMRLTLGNIVEGLLPVLGNVVPYFGLLLGLLRHGTGLAGQASR